MAAGYSITNSSWTPKQRKAFDEEMSKPVPSQQPPAQTTTRRMVTSSPAPAKSGLTERAINASTIDLGRSYLGGTAGAARNRTLRFREAQMKAGTLKDLAGVDMREVGATERTGMQQTGANERQKTSESGLNARQSKRFGQIDKTNKWARGNTLTDAKTSRKQSLEDQMISKMGSGYTREDVNTANRNIDKGYAGLKNKDRKKTTRSEYAQSTFPTDWGIANSSGSGNESRTAIQALLRGDEIFDTGTKDAGRGHVTTSDGRASSMDQLGGDTSLLFKGTGATTPIDRTGVNAAQVNASLARAPQDRSSVDTVLPGTGEEARFVTSSAPGQSTVPELLRNPGMKLATGNTAGINDPESWIAQPLASKRFWDGAFDATRGLVTDVTAASPQLNLAKAGVRGVKAGGKRLRDGIEWTVDKVRYPYGAGRP